MKTETNASLSLRSARYTGTLVVTEDDPFYFESLIARN